MGILDNILGGGDDEQQVTTEINYPDWWEKLYQPTMESLNPIYQAQAANPVHPLAQIAYRGMAEQALAGSPMRQGGMNYISQLMGGPAGGFPAQQPTGPQPQQTQTPPASPLDDIDFGGRPPAPPPPPAAPAQPAAAPPQERQAQLMSDMNSMVKIYDPRLGREVWVSNH
jgi:hypothetical protein